MLLAIRKISNYINPRLSSFLFLLKHSWKSGEFGKLVPSPILFLCNSGDRGYLYSGKKYSQLIDSINEKFILSGFNTLTIEQSQSIITHKSLYGNVIHVDGIISRAMLWYRIKRQVVSNVDKNNPVVNKWDKILKKINPKIIIGIQPSAEICLAAKQNNIWIADLQHGILSDEGYYGPSYREKYQQKGWPNCILCWDENSANYITKVNWGHVETKIIGNPWFLRFLEPNKNDKLLSLINKENIVTKKKVTILITLQWGIERFGVHHETGLPLGLYNFIINEGINYNWWIRAHPVQMEDSNRKYLYLKFKKAFNQFENIIWERPCEDPLPIILRQVDLHLTSHSFVTIEASWFGIKTALLMENKSLLFEYFNHQIEMGIAEIVDAEMHSIKSWIDKNSSDLKRNKKHVNYINSEMLNCFILDVQKKILQVS